MSQQSEKVKRWRENTKTKIVAALGGKCIICGYSRSADALDLHHVNKEEKGFRLGSVTSRPKRWELIVKECKKCVLLCANCHREFHAGIITLTPTERDRFDESRIPPELFPRRTPMDNCPVCGGPKPIYSMTCSRTCAGKRARRVDWDSINLKNLVQTIGSWTLIGDQLGISANAVRKRAKVLGLIQ